jgi:hypothetical protein
MNGWANKAASKINVHPPQFLSAAKIKVRDDREQMKRICCPFNGCSEQPFFFSQSLQLAREVF